MICSYCLARLCPRGSNGRGRTAWARAQDGPRQQSSSGRCAFAHPTGYRGPGESGTGSLTQLYQFAEKSELDQCDPPKSLHYSGELFQRRWTFTHTVVRGAAAYSPFHRSKTHLVYTTDDLRIGFVDRIHFFGRAHPENRAYALPIGKVGLIPQ